VTERGTDQKQEGSEVKTFPVPITLEEIKGNGTGNGFISDSFCLLSVFLSVTSICLVKHLSIRIIS